MARVVRPGGRVVVLEITTPRAPAAVLVLPGSGSTASCPRWAGWPATPTPTSTCPARVRRFPGPEELAARMTAAGLTDVRWMLTAGGIIALHSGTAGAHVNTDAGPAGGGAGGGRPELTRLLDGPRRGWPRSPRATAQVLGGHADGTLAAGGKRLRPMLVFLCGGGATPSGSCAAAAAVELLHMATLVHDDVLDRADAAPRAADGVRAAAAGAAATATGDLLFSRAFAELARPGGEDAVRALSAASSALARGELMQRADAWIDRGDAGALPRALPPEDRQPVRGLLPARVPRSAGGPTSADGLGGVRRADRPGVPDARRRARRVRARPSAPASRAARTCSTAP